MAKDVIAIVLAGGRSRRMGPLVGPGGKAAIDVDGDSMLAGVCRTMAGVADRVIVVAAEGQVLPPLPARVEVFRDGEPSAVPLVAIHEGLRHAGAGWAIAAVIACDVPRVEPAVLRLVVATAREPGVRWAVPVVGGHPQVLLSAVSADIEPGLAAATAAGEASPRGMLSALAHAEPAAVRWITELELVAIDPTLASFADIDTPEDLGRLARAPKPSS
jgi:molybdopterin-guanine dinucleotide biosynthesis protein A